MITKNPKKQNKKQKNRSAKTRNAEAYLWVLLNTKKFKGNKFFRHYQIGDFFVDFYCPDTGLAIVIDMDELYTDFHLESYYEREKYLESIGVNILHLDSKTILEESGLIIDRIVIEQSASAICESLKVKVDHLETLSLN
jgi:very-short-patch-repair endonuclease